MHGLLYRPPGRRQTSEVVGIPGQIGPQLGPTPQFRDKLGLSEAVLGLCKTLDRQVTYDCEADRMLR